MNLGAHTSAAEGLYKIFERAERVTANSIQLFVTNQNRWYTTVPKQEDIDLFHQAKKQFKPYTIITHSRYLLNLCSPKEDVQQKSLKALKEEIELCELLDIPYLVLHPGSYITETEQWGLDTIVKNLDSIISSIDNMKTVVLLETTAGQGTYLGATFEQLKYLLDNSQYPERVAICFDTCHTFSAGYDLKNRYEEVFEEFDEIVGIEHIKAFHLNDSMHPLGSKKDRHEHIGKGELGPEPFIKLMNDERFANVAMVLETPGGEEMDSENLKYLRSMRE